MTAFRTERLANGVTVAFVDQSNRYFGDYHRIRVEVQVTMPPLSGSTSTESPAPGCRQQTVYLERMGVAGADVETVRNRLAEDYWQHAGRYLAHAEYPARLAAAKNPSPRRLR
ncbi:MAG: hypothetical protein ACYC9I_01215 [Desulfuromonadales bacterium]